MKIDDINIDIIRRLRDGRKSFKEIADELAVTENTVRSRVSWMVDEGILDFSGLVDPEKLPGHRMVMVGVKLENMDLVNKGKEISTLKGVISVSVVTGQYDLILIVLLKEGFDILEFYTSEMSRIKGVRSVETFVVYKNYNMKLPYLL